MRRRTGGVATAGVRPDQNGTLARAFEPSRPTRPSPLAASTIRGIPLDLVDRIRSFSFFSSAPDDFLIAIGSCLRLQVYSPQESILNEGDEAKAMYWLIRGAVMVTSRDRESVYAELPPGAFFGEIGIMMNVPRTASIVARYKSLVARLNKEDLQKELPKYPRVERAIREEAAERLAILERKKRKLRPEPSPEPTRSGRRPSKRSHDLVIDSAEADTLQSPEHSRRGSNKKLKSPSPAFVETTAASALSSGSIHIRELLKELPLFSTLPDEFLHFLGLNAEACTYPPFTLILKQGSRGRDVFFLTDGRVEVFTEKGSNLSNAQGSRDGHRVLARLKAGQYFGEVTSLSLAPERTASVRTVTSVECLVISGDVIDELWRRCPSNLRAQVEATAKQRLEENNADFGSVRPVSHGSSPNTSRRSSDSDTSMSDASGLSARLQPLSTAENAQDEPEASQAFVSFQDIAYQNNAKIGPSIPEPFDPDPFFNTDRPSRRSATSRRTSLANVPVEASPLAKSTSGDDDESSGPRTTSMIIDSMPPPARPRMLSSHANLSGKGIFPESVLINILKHLKLHQLMRFRSVSKHWSRLLATSSDLLTDLNLSIYNRKITDEVLIKTIAPFVGPRPHYINISNCFHVSDEGFSALVSKCGENVTHWRMKSVWDISPGAIVQMSNKSQNLISLDFSNCRKVSDNLLNRVVGWVVRRPPSDPPLSPPHQLNHPGRLHHASSNVTVIGCPKLSRITLSYCKHVSDRFMQHLAHHAADRLEQMDLTRCTTISDAGFRHWSERPFPRLRQLILADCTYLSDSAITYLTQAARNLEELDLSFCCALSDAAVDRIAATLPRLRILNLAFCGSAVSDASMASIGFGLKALRSLSVRGCVRVTCIGVDAVVHGCQQLTSFDVSQCRNLILGEDSDQGRVKFYVVADGKWRVGD